MKKYDSYNARRERPVEHRDVQVIAGRVVEIRTQHIGESIWMATGRISEVLPTGPRLCPPFEVTASGQTEAEATEALKRLVAEQQNGSNESSLR